MRCFWSDSDDPFWHLAWEDVCLDRAAEVAPALLFSVNRPCVVIGKNQVPWRECATARLRADGVPMARRVSGGGAVFHDRGNLNYGFLLPRDTYRQEEVFALVIRALAALGIEAHVGAHNGLFAGGRKFSGSAFCYRRQHVLHHGTLLVDADLAALRCYCTPALPQIETKAIASRPASVVNLRELQPEATIASVAAAIAQEAGAVRAEFDDPAVRVRADEMRAWDWQWGYSPAFETVIGGCRLRIEHGRIVVADLPELVGLRFERDALRAAEVPRIGKTAAAFFQSLEVLDF